MERSVRAGECEQVLKNCGDILVGEAEFSILLGHLFFFFIFQRQVQMYRQFNTVSDHPQIPEQAFLFSPNRSNDPASRDDFRIGEGKGIRRLLFEGWAQETYTSWELQRLKQFEEYVARKGIKLDERWDKSWKMRWLLSTGCNIKKTLTDMDIFISYQQSVKDLQLTKEIAEHLRNGLFYVAGRDSHYRPILVFDVLKIIESGLNEDQLLEAQTYFFEYILRNLLIPGQVENWISVIDAGQTGLFSLASSMKRSFTFLSETYRSRMFVCYVVRIPSSISFIWAIVKKFIEEETVRKINFFDEQVIEPLLQFCNPSQLELKFGGRLENIQKGHFWPPRQVSKEYSSPKESTKILTRQEYTEYHSNGTLYQTKFHEENIIKPGTTEMRENYNYALIKKIEKEFKIEMEVNLEDALNFERDVRPYSEIKAPLDFTIMLAKNKNAKNTNQQQK